MMEADQLIQRFVDQELSARERVQFLAKLVRDERLREHAITLEQLLITASTLPRPVVPDRFVSTVMERIDRSQPAWRKIVDALFARPALRWNLASAAAGAFVALLAVWAGMAGRLGSSPSTPATTSTRPAIQPTVASAAASEPSTVLVRLVVLQPDAHTVQVAGDFNGWNPASTSLEQISNGAWTVTLPLQPGRYEYMLVVDGQHWIADPLATELSDDGFGARNAVLDVRRPAGSAL
jgi:hypothetical protein